MEMRLTRSCQVESSCSRALLSAGEGGLIIKCSVLTYLSLFVAVITVYINSLHILYVCSLCERETRRIEWRRERVSECASTNFHFWA